MPVELMPELAVRDGLAALAFYARAFEAVVEYQVGGSAENEHVVAQLAIHGARFWVADESPEHGSASPETVGGATARVLLVVEDPDGVVDRAVAAGAAAVAPVTEEHGWRLGRVRDPFGHHWEIGTPLGAWPPLR